MTEPNEFRVTYQTKNKPFPRIWDTYANPLEAQWTACQLADVAETTSVTLIALNMPDPTVGGMGEVLWTRPIKENTNA